MSQKTYDQIRTDAPIDTLGANDTFLISQSAITKGGPISLLRDWINSFYDLVSQAEAEAGTETEVRKWSPLRIAEAIAALETGPHEAVSQVEAEAGTETGLRSFSPLRIAEAIAALETPTPVGAHVVNAVDGTDIVAQFNALLTSLRNAGLIATE